MRVEKEPIAVQPVGGKRDGVGDAQTGAPHEQNQGFEAGLVRRRDLERVADRENLRQLPIAMTGHLIDELIDVLVRRQIRRFHLLEHFEIAL